MPANAINFEAGKEIDRRFSCVRLQKMFLVIFTFFVVDKTCGTVGQIEYSASLAIWQRRLRNMCSINSDVRGR